MTRTARLVLATGVLVVIAWAFISLIDRPIQYDEAYTRVHYATSPIRPFTDYSLPNNHMLYSSAMWFVWRAVGDSVISLRLIALFAAILSAALVYRIALRLSFTAALSAMMLFSSQLVIADYASNGRGYSIAILLTLLLIEIALNHRRWPPIVTVGCSAMIAMLALLTLPTNALMTGGLVIGLMIMNWRQQLPLIGGLIIGTTAGATAYLPWLLNGTLGEQNSRWGVASLADLLRGTVDMFTLTPVAGVMILIAALAGIVGLWSRHRLMFALVSGLISVAVLTAIAQSVALGSHLFPRNFVYLSGMLAILASIGLVTIIRSERVTIAISGALLTIAIAFMPVLAQPTPAQAVIDAISERATPADYIRIGCCVNYPAIYYHRLVRGQDYFTYNPSEQRQFIFIPTDSVSMDQLVAPLTRDFGVIAVNCTREQWDSVAVIRCDMGQQA